MLSPTFYLPLQYLSWESSFSGKVTQNFIQGLVLFLLNMDQELPFLYLAMQRLSLPDDLTQTQPTPSIMKINGTKSLNNYSVFFKNAQVSKKEGSSDWLICQLSAKLHKWHNSRYCPHLCTHKIARVTSSAERIIAHWHVHSYTTYQHMQVMFSWFNVVLYGQGSYNVICIVNSFICMVLVNVYIFIYGAVPLYWNAHRWMEKCWNRNKAISDKSNTVA